ncbi:MAG: FeoA family protein [Eubacteriales bacterium]
MRGGKHMTLDKLPPGESGIIEYVGGCGALRHRLIDMGLIPGTKVTVRKRAPLGDPIEICVRGYFLTLRLEDAACIGIASGGNENDICAGRQPEQRKNHAFQHAYQGKPACGELPGSDCRAKKRRNQIRKRKHGS